ncbi:MAG: P1 family peptidase [Vicinamibacterales bacterium]
MADARTLLKGATAEATPGGNTTLGVIATNRALTKAQATKVAQMAHDGVARTIYPIHTPADGDTIFAWATGTDGGPADVGRIGALAAQVMADAVLRAVREASGLPGYPTARDLGRPSGRGDRRGQGTDAAPTDVRALNRSKWGQVFGEAMPSTVGGWDRVVGACASYGIRPVLAISESGVCARPGEGHACLN